MTFGEALRRLRSDRNATDVAILALGHEVSAERIRDFGNYLSKIEHDKVPNVGLRYLRLIAKGLGYEKLSDFFRHIELRIEGLPLNTPPGDDFPSQPNVVSDDPSAPTVPPPLTRAQYENAIRILAAAALEKDKGKLRPNTRPASGDRRRAAGGHPSDRAHRPHLPKSATQKRARRKSQRKRKR